MDLLKKFMKEKRYSYRTLSEAMGVSHQALWNWVNGKREISLEGAYKIDIVSRGKISMIDILKASKKDNHHKRKKWPFPPSYQRYADQRDA